MSMGNENLNEPTQIGQTTTSTNKKVETKVVCYQRDTYPTEKVPIIGDSSYDVKNGIDPAFNPRKLLAC